MKKVTKKILAIALTLALIITSSSFVFAASCPPHYTYLVDGNVVSSTVEYDPHSYVKEYRRYPDGSIEPIMGTCNKNRLVYTYLRHWTCSKCGIITGTTTGTYNGPWSHPSCGG